MEIFILNFYILNDMRERDKINIAQNQYKWAFVIPKAYLCEISFEK